MSLFVPVPNYDSQWLAQSTLILPMVSIGNVPQLTADLFIHTFALQRIGFIDSHHVLPVSGAREDNQQRGTTVPIEVYQSSCRRWTCVQQRAPTAKGRRKGYVEDMVQFASQFQHVYLLTSVDASSRLDSQINSIPFRVLGKHTQRSLDLGVPLLETPADQKLHLPGAGLTSLIYEKLFDKATLFLMFALEGDNVQDSIEFGNYVNTALDIHTLQQWTPPKSWEFLFGSPFNPDLYH
ncbi:PAC2 family-domain-containing protein [Sporodiniella umbellata]|nr:PAC2 family-domain-containing protein [Sporodiniella umbellata]